MIQLLLDANLPNQRFLYLAARQRILMYLLDCDKKARVLMFGQLNFTVRALAEVSLLRLIEF